MEEQVAIKICKKISQITDGGILITDDMGNIVASNVCEAGDFPDTIHRLIMRDEELFSWDEDGKRGIVLALSNGERRKSYLLLSGNPKNLLPGIYGLKLAAETIIEYEGISQNKRQTKQGFIDALLSDTPNWEKLNQEAEELQIDQKAVRVPALIHVEADSRQIKSFMRVLESSGCLGKQDMLTRNEDGQIIIFKTVNCPVKQFMQEYKYILAQTLSAFLKYMRYLELPYRVYFGPAQCSFAHYRQAYHLCIWMKNMIEQEGSYYFYDYVVKYLEYEFPMEQMETFFFFLTEKLDVKFIEQYVDTMKVLIEQNYNLTKAGELLNIHKNTLVYRLDKIRNVLNMNPLNVNSDREFMECFYYYIKRLKEKESYGTVVQRGNVAGTNKSYGG